MYVANLLNEINDYLKRIEQAYSKVDFNEIGDLTRKASEGAQSLVEIDIDIERIDEELSKSKKKDKKNSNNASKIEKEILDAKNRIKQSNDKIKHYNEKLKEIDLIFPKEKRVKFAQSGPSFFDGLLGKSNEKSEMLKKYNNYEKGIVIEEDKIKEEEKFISKKEKELRTVQETAKQTSDSKVIEKKQKLLAEKSKYQKDFVNSKGDYDLDDLTNYLTALEIKNLTSNFTKLYEVSLENVKNELKDLNSVIALSFDKVSGDFPSVLGGRFCGDEKVRSLSFYEQQFLMSLTDVIPFDKIACKQAQFNKIEFYENKGKIKPFFDRARCYNEKKVKTTKCSMQSLAVLIPKAEFLNELKEFLQKNPKINMPEVVKWINETVLGKSTKKEEKELYATRKSKIEKLSRQFYLTPEQILIEDANYERELKYKQDELDEELEQQQAIRICESCIFYRDCVKTPSSNCASYVPKSRW